MNQNERRQFDVLCDTLILILDAYHNRTWLPNWLFKIWHPRGQQVTFFKKTIIALKHAIKADSSYKDGYDELLRILDNHRYFLAVHTVSRRLRLILQDAVITAFLFKADDVALYEKLVLQEGDMESYLKHFSQHEAIEIFREHFARQHEIFGVSRTQLSEAELTIYAKSEMINGRYLEYFGIRLNVKRNLLRIKNELLSLIDKKIEKGFLTLEKLNGLIERVDRIIEACDNPTAELSDDNVLIQYARYLIETIINTAGVKPLGPAKYSEHAILITACYWVDELLKQAQVKVEVV